MPPRKRKSERLQELQKAVETKRGSSATTTYDVDTQPNPSTSSEAVSMAPIATPSQDTGHEPNAATSTPANHTTSQTVPPAIIQAPVRDSAPPPPLSSGVQSAISHMNNTNGELDPLPMCTYNDFDIICGSGIIAKTKFLP